MRPILLVWHGIVLHSFHVMIYAALLVAVFLTVYLAQEAGLNGDRTAAAVVLAYIPAFVGARLLYVAGHWDRFRHEPARMWRRSEGGLSLYGGLVGLFAGVLPLLWALGLPFAPFFDALVPGILGGAPPDLMPADLAKRFGVCPESAPKRGKTVSFNAS